REARPGDGDRPRVREASKGHQEPQRAAALLRGGGGLVLPGAYRFISLVFGHGPCLLVLLLRTARPAYHPARGRRHRRVSDKICLRVLLVMPTAFETGRLGLENVIWLSEPVALTSVGTAIADRHEVKILDLRLEDEQALGRTLLDFAPCVVGTTSMTTDAYQA